VAAKALAGFWENKMSLLDVIKRPFKKIGSNLENYMGGLLGEDTASMSPEDRRRLRQRAISAFAEGMATMTPVSMTLREAAGEEMARRQKMAQQREMQQRAQAAQQASGQIAGRLLGGAPVPTAPGPMGGDELTGVNVQSQYRRDPMDAMRVAAGAGGADAMQVNPMLAELLKQNVGQQVVGGSIYDRATGQFMSPPREQGPKTPVRSDDLGDRVVTYFNDGTTSVQRKGLAPTAGGAGAGTVNVPGVGTVKLTPGEQQRDKDFAKGWTEFSSRGGFADTVKQVTQLQGALEKLKSGENLTGPFVGGLVQNFPALAAAWQSGAVSNKEAVEEVVQRNLKLILGAQFTQQEGERLIARAYNPSLSEEENARRLERLVKQMISAASSHQRAGEYFDQFGTLKGYDAKLPSFADFNVTGEDEGTDIGEVPAGIDPRDWKYMTPEARKLWR
jgi:hypothetical protein